MSEIKVGDVVGIVFAQPGNDTTYMLVERIDSDKARCWDVCFGMEVKDVEVSRLWLATERELQRAIGFQTKERKGTFTIQQLVDERLAARRS